MKDQFIKNLETFGSLVHTSTGKDFEKSNQALTGLNTVLSKEPKLVGFLMNEDNQKVLGGIVKDLDGKEPSLLEIPKIMGKLKKLKF
jgi:hypothetical protein